MATTQKTVPKKEPINTGHEAEYWRMADALRGSMDAAEYKHVVLGLIFLKYISDAFEERHAELLEEWGEEAAEDRDEYIAENIFWVPPEARWDKLQSQAHQPTIGRAVDDAMVAIERDNSDAQGRAAQGLRPAKPGQDPAGAGGRHGEQHQGRRRRGPRYGRARQRVRVLPGAVRAGRGSGRAASSTPRAASSVSWWRCWNPIRGRVYDPCCGSSGMFVQSIEFIRAHASGNGNGGRARGDISIYGQESNYTTWRMARMNLAIRGIEGQIEHGDSFHNDRHPDLRADYILANPPFNVSDWGGERLRDDKRWEYGVPPVRNANFAWVQHFLYHLAPRGTAGFVLANGSMSSNQSGEGEIRKNLIEAGLVDCIVALPGQLFRSTQIPACLWFLAKDRRNRSGKTLFIDARDMGSMIDRTRRDLTNGDIERIASTYHTWREGKDYEDTPGFCKNSTLEEIQKHGHVLTPGRYVGIAPLEDDGEPFEEKMARLTAQWREQQAEAARLDVDIGANLERLGFGTHSSRE